ncbi:hypothetical protein HU200_021774 [Digitaria exilis]|uniref:Reverse transcriptase zinc-binding domain-containing protein n=1 Tax=Digitaria exilis TaxID=1010633 RepID=A0A835EYW6_9POAL|nr:hypothetical protein HU200_021774 [Digitaria exilis]
MLRRKNKFLDNYTCVLCQQGVEETLTHLFFVCPRPLVLTVGKQLEFSGTLLYHWERLLHKPNRILVSLFSEILSLWLHGAFGLIGI